jgi:UDP-N-acetylmuramoyl-tripeptide--D-alanyl-D-alanine ligase
MNNYVGLPLVVLGYRGWAKTRSERARFLVTAPWRALASALSRGYPRVLVLEYGTDRSGYMKPMVELAPPTIAVVTTIGPAHLAGMGSLEGVVREKSVLVRYADPRGLVVVGDGHPFVADIAAQSSAPVVTVGGRGIDLAANVARVVAERLGVPGEVVVEALGGLKQPKSRLNWLRIGELAVLDDSYNANPLSMKLGLDTLASEAPRGGRKVTILGTMAELGEHEERYHREIGEYARGVADVLVGVGGPAKAYAADHWFEDAAACAEHVEQIVRPGDTILVKASASVGLGLVVERLTRAAAVGARD